MKVGVGYWLGVKVSEYPPDSHLVSKLKPEYISLPGWNEDISTVRKYSDLPKSARAYVEFIEKSWGSGQNDLPSGPERKQIKFRTR